MEINGYKIRPNANLRGADLEGADLRDADLRGADLRGADLRDANLRDANLRDADLGGANLRGANLEDADLRDANLRGANLEGADLPSQATLLIKTGIKITARGIVCYKSFGEVYAPNPEWNISKGSIISENFVEQDRRLNCGKGINVGSLDWCKRNCKKQIWKVLIKPEDLIAVVVPYAMDGKFRCARVTILEKHKKK